MAVMRSATLTAKIGADTSQFRRGMGQTESSLDRVKRAAGVAFAGAATSAVYFGVKSVKAYAEAEQSQNKLEDAYKRFPKLASVSIDSLRKYNQELQAKSRFDDDDIASAQARLAAFDLTGKQLKQITPLVLDYATATGQSVEASGSSLGKALLGNTRALKTLGINYTSTGDAAKDYDNILGLLQKKVGGRAFSDAKTAAGQLDILKNQFGELQESVGEALVPALEELVVWAQKMMPKFQSAVKRNLPVIKEAFSTLGDVAKTVGSVVGGAFKTFAALPPGVQQSAATLAGLAATLGLIKNSAVGSGIKVGVDLIGSLFGKGFKTAQVNAAVVNVNGAPGGVGGAGGAAGKGKSALSFLGPVAVGTIAALTVAKAIEVKMAGQRDAVGIGGRTLTTEADKARADKEINVTAPKIRGTGAYDFGNLKKKLDAVTDSTSNLSKASARYDKAQRDVTDTLVAASSGQLDYRQKSEQGRRVLAQLVGTGNAYVGSLRRSKASAGEVAEAQRNLKDRFFQTAKQLGRTDGEALDLWRSLGLIKSKNVSVTVDTSQADNAVSAFLSKWGGPSGGQSFGSWSLGIDTGKPRMFAPNLVAPEPGARSFQSSGGLGQTTSLRRDSLHPYDRGGKVVVELDGAQIAAKVHRRMPRTRQRGGLTYTPTAVI